MGWQVTFGVALMALLVASGVWRLLAFLGVVDFTRIYGKSGSRETPYLTRLVIGSLRLHVFWRGDEDPHPHNHPWDFWTFPLVSYFEEVVELAPYEGFYWRNERLSEGAPYTRQRLVPAWRWHKRPAETLHRVLYPCRCRNGWSVTAYSGDRVRALYAKWPIVTVVWTGRRKASWGFKVDGEVVDWKQYYGWKEEGLL